MHLGLENGPKGQGKYETLHNFTPHHPVNITLLKKNFPKSFGWTARTGNLNVALENPSLDFPNGVLISATPLSCKIFNQTWRK